MKTRPVKKLAGLLLAFVMVLTTVFSFGAVTAKAAVFQDILKSGNYVLTEDSYIATAVMKMPAYIVIDAEKDTFNIHPYKDGVADLETDKGSGSISFDEATGVYTLTYETIESAKGYQATITATENSITFTSPMKYGGARMNTQDENGVFASYTALLQGGQEKPEPEPEAQDILKTGNYVLTEDSYIATAVMKMPAYIVIDAEKDTFNIHPYKDNVADLETDKGSGTISFDKATGVYTLTYETIESAKGYQATITATENSITFTSPMKYGGARMNTLDENGVFAPYTALLQGGQEKPEPEKPVLPENQKPVDPENQKPVEKWSEPEFTWSEDGKTCTAVFTNETTGEKVSIETKATSKIKKQADSKHKGITTYTAEFKFKGKVYKAEKDLEDIPMKPAISQNNKKPVSPKTADTSNIMLMFALLMISGAGLYGSIYKKIR